ncbi:MAG: T9SS C-terminal target domain-containing protein [Calditrichaeota bacterium]|nr:MAG: T9SS C-terminal target domain-containing protein [Calditrichota bacterium]MBL1205410.1 T9SS C-terminal target domain-containing protein [Calditrichota bacterium]NOG45239.1 T9SS type A sorting domain-containing protein [Calditrichota bacterium]
MKKLILALAVSLFAATVAQAQVWQFDKIFSEENTPHGVVQTPDGKIWVANFSRQDTLVNAPGDTLFSNPVRIYNEDGTFDAFIRTVTVSAVTDTIVQFRGISLDYSGNVFLSIKSNNGQYMLFRVNYQTRVGMHKFAPDNGSMTEATETEDGYTYVGHVGGNKPCYILDEDLALFSFVDDTVSGLQRSVLVTPDGNDVYFGKIYSTGYGVRHYQSTDGGGAESESFALMDTFATVFDDTGAVASAMWAQCLDWDNNGLMWVGTYWDVAAFDFSGWYALDPTQDWAVVDTIGHNADTELGNGKADGEVGAGSYWSPRGITFSADGKTAYTADFDGGYIHKWTNADPKGPGSAIIPLSELVVTALEDVGGLKVAVSFELKQNYPNPFNPSTSIPFSINATKHVTLKVYDISGRLVSTLIDGKLSPSNYEYQFDGSNLASGTYIYRLNVDGQQVSNRMLLIK